MTPRSCISPAVILGVIATAGLSFAQGVDVGELREGPQSRSALVVQGAFTIHNSEAAPSSREADAVTVAVLAFPPQITEAGSSDAGFRLTVTETVAERSMDGPLLAAPSTDTWLVTGTPYERGTSPFGDPSGDAWIGKRVLYSNGASSRLIQMHLRLSWSDLARLAADPTVPTYVRGEAVGNLRMVSVEPSERRGVLFAVVLDAQPTVRLAVMTVLTDSREEMIDCADARYETLEVLLRSLADENPEVAYAAAVNVAWFFDLRDPVTRTPFPGELNWSGAESALTRVLAKRTRRITAAVVRLRPDLVGLDFAPAGEEE